jgi:hypothetical protein
MQRKIAYVMLLSVIVPALIAGCAASRTYSEGILATSDTSMSTEELQEYSVRISQEIDRVNKGGAVPAGVTREVYLEDLKSRQKTVRDRSMIIEHLKQKEEFEDRYPSP